MDDKDIIGLYFDRSEQTVRETAERYGGLCASIAYNILGSREVRVRAALLVLRQGTGYRKVLFVW